VYDEMVSALFDVSDRGSREAHKTTQFFLGKVPPLATKPHEIAEGTVQGIQITLRHGPRIMPVPTQMSIWQTVGNASESECRRRARKQRSGRAEKFSDPHAYGLVVPDMNTATLAYFNKNYVRAS
jgi:hypothetical protein